MRKRVEKKGPRPGCKFTPWERSLIIALYAEGKTDAQIAQTLGLGRRTFANIRDRSKITRAAVKKAKDVRDEQVEHSLLHRALGYSHPAVKIFCHQGRIIRQEYTEHYPPDTAAAVFWLCNRQPEKWKNVQKIEASGALTILNDDDYGNKKT